MNLGPNKKQSSRTPQTLYPVILTVPPQTTDLEPRERVTYLSRHARQALKLSAEKSGLVLERLKKDDRGVPLPSNGIYWSLTHKPRYVGGVAAQTPVGIDIEQIRPCSENLFRKTATQQEWELAGSEADSLPIFFRYWTAKESVLKISGDGLTGLSKCRIQQIIDDRHLTVAYHGRAWHVEHLFFDNHVASIVKDTDTIEWTVG